MSNKTVKKLRVTITKHILDENTRNRRNRQHIEQLERDNFQDEPHKDLVMHKKAPRFENFSNNSNHKRNNAKKIFNLNSLIEENSRVPSPNYLTIATGSLSENIGKPGPRYLDQPRKRILSIKRYFCSVCGFKSNYTCITCGLRYCSLHCLEIHIDTRCLKWTV